MPAIPSPHERLIIQIESIAVLNDSDRAGLKTLPLRLKSIGENRDIVREGASVTDSCLIISGVVCCYKVVAGGRRQILSFHFAGDMPDLQSLHLNTADHSLAALTPVQVAFISHEAIRVLMRANPGVNDALIRHLLIDSSIFREWVANVGRRNAIERIAHVICECFVRMRALGLATATDLELPLTQSEIGDATGLSNVHVNRTLKELRRKRLISTNGKIHSILDWEALQETADFDPAYLHLRRLTPA